MNELQVRWRVVPQGEPRRDTSRALLAELGCGVALQQCAQCGGPHGPIRLVEAPVLASVTYAVSAVDGRTVAIAATLPAGTATALGIDAEFADESIRERAGLAEVLNVPTATVRDWVRVEAALKADGRGLHLDPASVRVTAAGERWMAVLEDRDDVLSGWDIAGPEGVLLSAAVVTA